MVCIGQFWVNFSKENHADGRAQMMETDFTALQSQFTSSSSGKNPKLPKYDGSTDPQLWFKQVGTAFQAQSIAPPQRGPWMLTAHSGPAMQFLYVECDGKIQAIPAEIMRVRRERFHHCTDEYAIDFKFTLLRMQNGQLEAANRQFNTLLAQAPWKTQVDLFTLM